MLSVIEVTIRAIATFGLLPTPLAWYSVDAQHQADDLARLAEIDAESKLVFVGTSMTGEGIDGRVIEEEIPSLKQVYNLALDGAQPPVVERWLEEEVRPTLSPSAVVWGISSLDLNGNRSIPVIRQYDAASATRTGRMGDVIRAAERSSYLYRYRALFRDPAAFVSGRISTTPTPVRAPDELGNYPLGDEVDYKTERERARIRTEVLSDFAVGADETAAFKRELTTLRDDGVEVLVVLMPVPPSYIELHPNGREDFDSFVVAASEVVSGLDIRLVDASDWFGESDFRDHTHLRRSPAEEFSLRLVDELRDLELEC